MSTVHHFNLPLHMFTVTLLFFNTLYAIIPQGYTTILYHLNHDLYIYIYILVAAEIALQYRDLPCITVILSLLSLYQYFYFFKQSKFCHISYFHHFEYFNFVN